ncbi:XdhC family protein [Oceanobacillus massiliensis]|uniref:XdhC family protein n=1 Tax=Oceanobacillus massiliensis TaxID=1465765 RepID=UPI00301B0C10
MEDMHSILEVIASGDSDGVLATVIQVDGSAYKKEGAAMFLDKEGSAAGLISAGCLEEDLIARVEQGMISESEVIVYDMSGYDDLSWGEGSGCNGVIHVLAERVDADYREHLLELKANLMSGIGVTLVKIVPSGLGNQPAEYVYMTETNQRFGTWQGGLPASITELIRGARYNKNGKYYLPELSKEVYVHHYEPRPRLIVFGAGKDAVPLVSLMSTVGFSVTVSDWRAGLCDAKYFPAADRLIIGFPSVKLVEKEIRISSGDYVILLTHNFKKDRELLSILMNKQLKYLGVLGSGSRTKRLFESESLSVPDFIRTPVGLSISAEGPEEIAVSIAAELIKCSKQRLEKEVESSNVR